MTATTVSSTRRDLETKLIEKAWKDPAFKQALISDPRGLIERYTGQKLPEQMRVFVHEEDANTLHFSIPAAPTNATQLSDAELEYVAGRTDFVPTALVVAATLLTSMAGVAAGKQNGW